ncbi:hypothetical protein [Leptospira gomenensis]|nr:hypothetical protein [Leptospira gomenensis]
MFTSFGFVSFLEKELKFDPISYTTEPVYGTDSVSGDSYSVLSIRFWRI